LCLVQKFWTIVVLIIQNFCVNSRKSGIVDSRHREIFRTFQIFWNRGFASQRDLVDVPELLELFIFVLDKIVPGLEILDHRCFKSFRISVYIPENLELLIRVTGRFSTRRSFASHRDLVEVPDYRHSVIHPEILKRVFLVCLSSSEASGRRPALFAVCPFGQGFVRIPHGHSFPMNQHFPA
jgi:hypothetical protein